MGGEDSDNKTSGDYFVETMPKWSVTVSETQSARENISTGCAVKDKEKEKEMNLLLDIERKGEEYLRKRLKHIISLKSENNLVGVGKAELTKSERITEETYTSLTRKDEENNLLRGLILNRNGKHQKSGKKTEKILEKRPRPTHLNPFTDNQKEMVAQRKLLEKFIPVELSDTQEGLMYYRVSKRECV